MTEAEKEMLMPRYRGSGRLTGQLMPDTELNRERNRFNGFGIGTQEELIEEFLKEEHLEFGHEEHKPGCPICARCVRK
jgi:hypothetical protein